MNDTYVMKWEKSDASTLQIAKIRKLYVYSHIDKEAFIQLLECYGLETLKLCEFIEVADKRRDEIEREQKCDR